MVRIEHEHDIEVLRQVARLLDRENEKLHARLAEQARQLARLDGSADAQARLALELERLQEMLSRHERALFGDSSEQRPREASDSTPQEPPAKRGHGPRSQPNLPIQIQLHELPASERGCGVCGGALEEMTGQAEEAEEITVIERRFVIVLHQRQKYRCACNANLVTADGPPKLQPGSRYAPEFALEVAASKYLDHLPLERQVRIMAREGLVVDSQTLWDQLLVLARHLTPTYEALGKGVLGSPLVHADETWWRLMGKGAPKRWWVWAVATRSAAFYRILDSRSQAAGREMLQGYHGKVMADGYGAYAALGRDGPGFVLAHCWAHVRRRFVEIEETYPRECREVLDLIGELYGVEAVVPALRANATPEEEAEILRLRAELREQRSRAIVRRIQEWVYAQQPLPRSGLGSALTYLKGMWAGLTLFLDDPQIPLDNNLIERGLRGPALGRKNHYGSRSKRGAEVAAIFYSLFESAKLCGVEPKAYVLKAIHAALAEPGTVTLPQSLLS